MSVDISRAVSEDDPATPRLQTSLSRKQLLKLGAGLAVAPLFAAAGCGASSASGSTTPRAHPHSKPALAGTSLDRAYAFLDAMMDSYATGSSLRLARSYVDTPALSLGDLGFLYDNALLLIALTRRGSRDDLVRAAALGDSILYAQQHEGHHDGRLHDSYHTNPFIRSDGSANEAPTGSAVSNLAWAGLALIHLYVKTRKSAYLAGAEELGTWIDTNARDTRGAGGFTGGIDTLGQKILWKSTEHNIDCYALFRALAGIIRGRAWQEHARHALTFLQSMWNPQHGHFWTGTTDNGVSATIDPIPEDVQTWPYLATLDATFRSAVAWTQNHLAATDHSFSGVSFSTADRSKVWFEGTAHLAAALIASGGPSAAAPYLQTIELAQKTAGNTDGQGIVAASADGLNTGFGDQYFDALHVGTTAWYCIAKLGMNPFRPV